LCVTAGASVLMTFEKPYRPLIFFGKPLAGVITIVLLGVA
jgi:hypothetical protein